MWGVRVATNGDYAVAYWTDRRPAGSPDVVQGASFRLGEGWTTHAPIATGFVADAEVGGGGRAFVVWSDSDFDDHYAFIDSGEATEVSGFGSSRLGQAAMSQRGRVAVGYTLGFSGRVRARTYA